MSEALHYFITIARDSNPTHIQTLEIKDRQRGIMGEGLVQISAEWLPIRIAPDFSRSQTWFNPATSTPNVGFSLTYWTVPVKPAVGNMSSSKISALLWTTWNIQKVILRRLLFNAHVSKYDFFDVESVIDRSHWIMLAMVLLCVNLKKLKQSKSNLIYFIQIWRNLSCKVGKNVKQRG